MDVLFTQQAVLPNVLLFILLVCVQYTARQTLDSAINCLQTFCRLIHCVPSCHAASARPTAVVFVPNIRKTHRPKGLFCWIYCPNSVFSVYKAAYEMHRSNIEWCGREVPDGKSTPLKNPLLFRLSQNIWPEMHIVSYCMGPRSLNVRAYIFYNPFSIVTIVAFRDHAHCMLVALFKK